MNQDKKSAIYVSPQEFTLDFFDSEQRFVLPPLAAKALCAKLEKEVGKFEEEHGKIPLEKRESTVLQSIKENLFYRKKVSSNVFAVNPRKKEK